MEQQVRGSKWKKKKKKLSTNKDTLFRDTPCIWMDKSIVEKGRLLGHGCRNVVTKYHFQFDPLVPFVSPDHVSCFQFTTKIPLLCARSANQTRSNQKDQQIDEKRAKKNEPNKRMKTTNGTQRTLGKILTLVIYLCHIE